MFSMPEIRLNCNRDWKINFDGGDLSSDAGLLLFKEFIHRFGVQILLDLDSTLCPTYGKQEGSAFNYHYQAEGYHPLLCFDGLTGDLLKAELRNGSMYCSKGAADFLKPLLAEYKEISVHNLCKSPCYTTDERKGKHRMSEKEGIMKKYLAMILTLCVLGMLAGCAGSKTETIPETTEAVTAVIQTQPKTTEETDPDPVNKLDPAAITDNYIDDIPEKGDPTAVIGDYMDLTSQRARMTLDYDFEKDIYICEVTWANSAREQEVWKMHWTDIGNGKYVYDDGEHLKVTYAENGEATTTVLAQNQSGFFTYDNADDLRVTENAILDRFFWDGAADENCRSCHFEQME